MSNEIHSANSTGNGGYERQDIGVAPVVYFLLALVVAGGLVHVVVSGLYSYLEKRSEAEQTAVSPLVTNAPADTRHLSTNYQNYLKQNFPAPQLEIDERNQLDKIRIDEAETLSTYDWVDQKAGTVRIPIDRAMDLIAQRGLPVRTPTATEAALAGQPSKPATEPAMETKKGTKH
jgi:hypothetical protein